jgi:hypothetical protein
MFDILYTGRDLNLPSRVLAFWGADLRKGTGTVMAMAGHADVLGREIARDSAQARFREILRKAYHCVEAGAAIALLVYFPPHFSLNWMTLLSVVIVALFLVDAERPQRYGVTSLAPLTAVLAASAAVLGAWTMVLAFIAFNAVRWRVYGDRGPLKLFVSFSSLGQTSMAVIATYPMLGVMSAAGYFTHIAPPVLSGFIFFGSVLAAGLVWQSVNNGSVAIACAIMGQRFAPGPLVRTGIVASLWAYFLAALYMFGGIFATIIFYVAVAKTRMFDEALGIIENVRKVEVSQMQAQVLLSEIARLSDVNGSEFPQNVKFMAGKLARMLGLSKREIEQISLAAELHEIGLCRLPAEVRNAANLTHGQREMRQRYSVLGGDVLSAANALIPKEVAQYVALHTEHYDGNGPHGTKQDRIPLGARIIAVARAYIQLVAGYGEQPPVPTTVALKIMLERAGTVYDPTLVDLLIRATG